MTDHHPSVKIQSNEHFWPQLNFMVETYKPYGLVRTQGFLFCRLLLKSTDNISKTNFNNGLKIFLKYFNCTVLFLLYFKAL